jgi:hypothetical protein
VKRQADLEEFDNSGVYHAKDTSVHDRDRCSSALACPKSCPFKW